MRKILLTTLLLFTVVLTPQIVSAKGVSVTLSCPQAANKNDQIDCRVNVSTDTTLNGLSANYSLSGLTYVNFTPQSGFSAYSKSPAGFAVGNNDGKTGNFTVGIVTLKVTDFGTIQLKNLDASDTDYASYSPAGPSTNIRLKSTNNNLSGLSLSNGSLSPGFNSNTTSYSATIDAPNVTIHASKGDERQSIDGAGYKNLNYGNNNFDIHVTSESGSRKTYRITINRPDNRSDNNNLRSLSTNNGSISFNKNNTNYSLNVESNVSSINISAEKEDGRASFVNGAGPRTVNLNYGDNRFEIKVRSEKGNVKTYVINVHRKDDRSTNNNLKSLKVSEGKINFDKDTLEYNISVYYEVTKIEITAEAEDEKAKVSIDNKDLVVGENTLTITVTSENQSVKKYIVKVKRLREDEKPSDNNNIKVLKVFGRELKLKNKKYDYEVKINEEETELILDITLEDEKASYTIKNNKNLENESVVTIETLSESGLTATYKIKVEKENSAISYITIGILGIAIGLVFGLIISKLKPTKKQNNVEVIKEESVEEPVIIAHEEVKLEDVVENIEPQEKEEQLEKEEQSQEKTESEEENNSEIENNENEQNTESTTETPIDNETI